MKIPPFKASAGIKILIGIIAGVVVIIGGFLLIQNVFIKAADTAPRDLIISTISANGAKIAWTTDQVVQGVVEYGSSPTSLNLFAPESQKTKSHSVDITLLSPATSYYFQIRIGDTKFDNGGVPWTFATKMQQVAPTGGVPGDPSVATPSGLPAVNGTPLPTQSAAVGPTGSPFGSKSLSVNPTVIPTPRSVATVIPTVSPTPATMSYYCVETDCVKLCQNIKAGTGCSTLDFTRPGNISANNCGTKVNLSSCTLYAPTPTWNPLTPTLTPTPTPSITNTPTPTPSPTTSPAPTIPSYMQ